MGVEGSQGWEQRYFPLPGERRNLDWITDGGAPLLGSLVLNAPNPRASQVQHSP
jgi:hypothetical protein